MAGRAIGGSQGGRFSKESCYPQLDTDGLAMHSGGARVERPKDAGEDGADHGNHREQPEEQEERAAASSSPTPCETEPTAAAAAPTSAAARVLGPTALIPGSITADAHERFNSRDDGGRERVALLREAPNHVGSLSVGDVNIIDSRLIHAGGANGSSKRRVLFYVSFRRRGARTPTGSLLYKLRREGFALNNRAEWARAS